MPQLDFSFWFSQMAWLLVCFGGFFLVSKYLLLPAFDKIISKRDDTISSNINFANETIQKINKIKADCDAKLSSAKQKNDEQIAEIIKECKKNNEKKLEEVKQQCNQEITANIDNLKIEAEKIQKDLEKQADEIAKEIVKKVYKL